MLKGGKCPLVPYQWSGEGEAEVACLVLGWLQNGVWCRGQQEGAGGRDMQAWPLSRESARSELMWSFSFVGIIFHRKVQPRNIITQFSTVRSSVHSAVRFHQIL